MQSCWKRILPTRYVGQHDPTYVVFSCFSFFSKAIWKRRISIYRRTGKIDKAAHELSQYLDTFYTDVEGWLELADIYASSNQ